MSNDEWKCQASFKFGPNATALLNVRDASLEELENECRKIPNVAGTLVVAAETLAVESDTTGRAVGVVAQSFPGSTVVGAQHNTLPAAPAPQPAPAAPAAGHTVCAHGARVKRTGGLGNDAWEGYFCPLQKNDPNRCKPVYPSR